MKNYILLVLTVFIGFKSIAQNPDTLFAVKKGSSFVIRHILKNRESFSMLAQRYYTSLSDIETLNEFDAKKKLAVGDYVYIPLTKDNFYFQKQPLEITNLNNLYYKMGDRENLSLVVSYFPAKKNEVTMTKEDLRNLNGMHGYNVQPGQAIQVGWVRMLPRDSFNVAMGIGYPQTKKTVPHDTVKHYFGGLETDFSTATQNGANIINEKGTAVFFDKPGKNNVYFAFHNTCARNTVIKVYNPGNEKTIFVKVIGPIPDTKAYSNSVIAISKTAMDDLGATENRIWVELTYPPN